MLKFLCQLIGFILLLILIIGIGSALYIVIVIQTLAGG
ncbi:hypothetical protein BBC0244_022970 [Bartonella apihabitans]|nr:hypothetical protein BBC0244_022970 [Bartonella apihabitans]